MKKPIVALIYDFDGTLSPGNMQEFGFIQAIGKTPAEFWRMSDEIAKGQDASNVLAYMKLMFDEARKAGIRLRRENFKNFGQHIELFEGVREWFSLVNEYGRSKGVTIEHYINSSGLKEIIEGSPIAGEFKHIFAGTFIYDDAGDAEWPGIAIDATGAGDTYAAGFLYAHSLGLPLKACGEVGSIIAAKVVEVIGTKIDIPRWKAAKEEIRALIAKYNSNA